MYENMKARAVCGTIVGNYIVVKEMAVNHPTNPTKGGALCRNTDTDIYCIISAGAVFSVPNDWAQAEEMKEIRRLSGLSQLEFSGKYKIPKRTIENWENSVRQAPQYVIDLLRTQVERDYGTI